MIATADGGYAVAGDTLEGAGVVRRLDASGELQWERKFGDFLNALGKVEVYDTRARLTAAADGGYVVAHTLSIYDDTGNDDASVLKLNAEGELQWERTFKGDGINAIIATADGGYAAAGWTRLEGASRLVAWVLKLGPNGQTSDSFARQ